MQLRKCCNHPYLFQGAEPGPPYTTGDHLVTSSGLDRLQRMFAGAGGALGHPPPDSPTLDSSEQVYISSLALLKMLKHAVNKDELLQMVRFGAEMVFSSKDSTITDEDIDRIIAKGEAATAELDAKMKKFTEDAIKSKMDDTAELYEFDDDKDENKFDIKKIVSENSIEPSKRERKRKEESTWHLLMRYCAGFTEQSKRENP
ncbi:ISWI chromatin-remodeling complex ATPase CHR11-like isoform X1 [Gossypium arboreum]|uniref:ISWI chromatin-remodeling complex ATPase CHR11-like isoform X1 n=1 Tax=Gossypium arboreum TaxID=29729 RepID=UPI0022F1BB36|nr:ISWI chromatin-remodeling complex ATPase CHR11-like isoform X1 [Gossypium arboreum]XP_052875161.1 ISWI chromatin-remodeling complex ATPase CHR11-like isoform X1 [Gossypium arboreum]XP_052875162.1 ISWI chromatin-remodeling complex ATPase CHR11-like isoform X1 [Gossypium arboreum]XP_052875163.1 ISWI chromatin-remodeling complex ATPase CHR11-like isoform X1 [Gossypium arboreum]